MRLAFEAQSLRACNWGFTVRDWLVYLLVVQNETGCLAARPTSLLYFRNGEKKQHEMIVNIIFHAVLFFLCVDSTFCAFKQCFLQRSRLSDSYFSYVL
jgi:hypothetical protein